MKKTFWMFILFILIYMYLFNWNGYILIFRFFVWSSGFDYFSRKTSFTLFLSYFFNKLWIHYRQFDFQFRSIFRFFLYVFYSSKRLLIIQTFQLFIHFKNTINTIELKNEHHLILTEQKLLSFVLTGLFYQVILLVLYRSLTNRFVGSHSWVKWWIG